MATTQTPFIAFFAINHENNGLSEAWHLRDTDIVSARATVKLLAEARSFLLARNCVLEWAAVRQVAFDYIEWPAIDAPLAPLPQWDVVDNDGVGLLWRFSTGNGLWANHLIRYVEDAETVDYQWPRVPFILPAIAPPRPANPAAAAKDTLYRYALCLFRDRTCHAEDTDPANPVPHNWQLTPWDRAMFRMVSRRAVGSSYQRASWEPREYTRQPGFSPCGTSVTVLRSCYEQDCRFFLSAPTQGIRYYWSAPGADVFPFATIFWGWRRDKEIMDGQPVGEVKGKASFAYSKGLSWGAAPGLIPGGTPQQFLGQTVCPWGNDPVTPLVYQETCDMPVPLPITVDDNPGAVTVLNVTRMSFHEDDFSVTEVAPGWARVRLKNGIDLRDHHAWRDVRAVGGWYVAGLIAGNFQERVVVVSVPAWLGVLPIVPGKGGVIADVGIRSEFSARSGLFVRMSLWEEDAISANVQPGNLLFDTGWRSVTDTVFSFWECGVQMRPDRLYFLGIEGDGPSYTPDFTALPGRSFLSMFSDDTDNGYPPAHCLLQQGVSTGPLPPGGFLTPWQPYDGITLGLGLPLLYYRMATDSYDPLYIAPSVISFVLDFPFAMVEYTPPSASIPLALDLTLDPACTMAAYTPPSAAMPAAINLTLEPVLTMAEYTPPAAAMAMDLEFTLEAPFVMRRTVSQLRAAGLGISELIAGQPWLTPDNLGAIDAVYATSTLLVGVSTAYLRATDFGFTLPGGTDVVGIVVRIMMSASEADQLMDESVLLCGTGVAGAFDKGLTGHLPTVDTLRDYGDAGDAWTETITDAEVNDASFGVRLRISSDPVGVDADVQVDYIEIELFYLA